MHNACSLLTSRPPKRLLFHPYLVLHCVFACSFCVAKSRCTSLGDSKVMFVAFLSPTPLFSIPKRTRSSSSNRTPPVAETRTCSQCKTLFDTEHNHPVACRFHPGLYTGDSLRKGVWEGSQTKGSGAVERFWWCCGAKELDAPGCVACQHRGYE